MTTNIIIGKKSFVTKSLLKYLNKAEVFSLILMDGKILKSNFLN